MKRNSERVPLLRLAPEIWKYQIFTKALFIPLFPLVRAAALAASDAFGGGSFALPSRAWTIPLALLATALYLMFDLNAKILYAANMLNGVTESLFSTLKRALAATPKCGLGAFLYMALLAPVVGTGVFLLKLENPNAPNLDAAPPWPPIAYAAFALIFFAFAAAPVLRLHGVLLDGLSVKQARRRSASLIRTHWRDIYRHHFVCFLTACAVLVLTGIALFSAPLSLGARILPARYGPVTARSVMILLFFLNVTIFGALALLLTPRYVLGLTKLYRAYAPEASDAVPRRAPERHPALVTLAFFYILEIAALASQTSYSLDAFFPPLTETKIIAHRGGGYENAENTLSGLETAIALGVYGSEIDIQRTLDGRYIVNHDPTFRRLADDSRAPEEMTLEEVLQLRYPVPTLDEMLDAAKGRITLFIELKGGTADEQMCDDVAQMLLDRDMLQEAVLISFDYDLLDYAELRWPNVQTGYLTAFFEGNASYFPSDYVGLEETVATPEIIRSVHRQGKKLLIWTPDAPKAQERFFIAQADAIITNEVTQAKEVLRDVNRGEDLGQILSAFR